MAPLSSFLPSFKALTEVPAGQQCQVSGRLEPGECIPVQHSSQSQLTHSSAAFLTVGSCRQSWLQQSCPGSWQTSFPSSLQFSCPSHRFGMICCR